MKKISLKDKRWGDTEHYTLDAYINDQGDLVLEGYEAGDSVKEWHDDFDYEYWHTVNVEFVHDVLLNLIKDRFDNASDYLKWLEEKGIEYESVSF